MRYITFSEIKSKWFMSLVCVIILCFTADIRSQSIGRVGTTAASFLKIGVGGRALGMGEAYSTQAEDITAMYWNPAGLSSVQNLQVLFNHYNYIADIYFDYGGIALPIENIGTIGVSVTYMGMPDIERTTIQSPNGTGEMVSAGSFALGVSYARALTDRFLIGGTAKYIRENIWHSSASGFGFDIGLIYTSVFKNLKIGMSISNFGTEMKMDGRDLLIQHDINPIFAGNNENINSILQTDGFPLPILFRVGLSVNVLKDFFNLKGHDWILSVDAIHPNDNKEYMNLGTEVKLYDLIALRGGYRQLLLEDREGGLTFGAGLYLNVFDQAKMMLDYANVDMGRLDHTNKFSVIISF